MSPLSCNLLTLRSCYNTLERKHYLSYGRARTPEQKINWVCAGCTGAVFPRIDTVVAREWCMSIAPPSCNYITCFAVVPTLSSENTARRRGHRIRGICAAQAQCFRVLAALSLESGACRFHNPRVILSFSQLFQHSRAKTLHAAEGAGSGADLLHRHSVSAY